MLDIILPQHCKCSAAGAVIGPSLANANLLDEAWNRWTGGLWIARGRQDYGRSHGDGVATASGIHALVRQPRCGNSIFFGPDHSSSEAIANDWAPLGASLHACGILDR